MPYQNPVPQDRPAPFFFHVAETTAFIRHWGELTASLNPNHSRLTEQTTAAADDEYVHEPTIWSSMAGDESKVTSVWRDMKDTKGSGRLQRSEQCIQRHGGWSGVGRIAATPIVNEINPRSICALRDASGAAEDAELNVVRNLRKARRPVHFFNCQTPVVKAPWIAYAQHPLRFQKRDRNGNSEIPGGADAVEPENLERPWKLPSNGKGCGNHHGHHRD